MAFISSTVCARRGFSIDIKSFGCFARDFPRCMLYSIATITAELYSCLLSSIFFRLQRASNSFNVSFQNSSSERWRLYRPIAHKSRRLGARLPKGLDHHPSCQVRERWPRPLARSCPESGTYSRALSCRRPVPASMIYPHG